VNVAFSVTELFGITNVQVPLEDSLEHETPDGVQSANV
jgi:hypothetical protein